MIHAKTLPALTAAAFLLAPALGPAPAAAAEIKVLNANALTIAMKPIAAEFTKETGHQVTFAGMSPGLVDQRVKAGEVYDIIINAIDLMAAYEKDGRLRAGTRRPFARVGIGLGVREGTKVDLSSVESTKKALLDAKAITYTDSSTGGLSGINAAKVIANLGLTEALKGKTIIAANGRELIAKGEVDIGLYNMSEIARFPGVVPAGPVPPAVQVYINYDAAVPATNTAPEPALALLKYLIRPASRAEWTQHGLEVVGE
ncbi:MAG: molybdate transport system substrate-binding protein [Alphaproteobacteria bacterium]|nr:molybdate transport system substrate-binding protein [Alphaproteobacteria bacterium]